MVAHRPFQILFVPDLAHQLLQDVLHGEDAQGLAVFVLDDGQLDAVAAHQQKKALDLYYDLLALKEAPMRILYLITNQFQRLMVVKAMTNQGFSNRDIAPKAGCPEWAVKKYQSQCRAFHMEQLKKAIADGVEYETAVKTGRMNDQMAVELFIVEYSRQAAK